MNIFDKDFIDANRELVMQKFIELQQTGKFLNKDDYCLVNNQLIESERIYNTESYNFDNIIKNICVNKLFKYYSNISNSHINYSHEAIRIGKIFLSHPNGFNDPLESIIINVNDKNFKQLLFPSLVKKFILSIDEKYNFNVTMDLIILLLNLIFEKYKETEGESDQEKLYKIFKIRDNYNNCSKCELNKFFVDNILTNVDKYRHLPFPWHKAIIDILEDRAEHLLSLADDIKNIVRISCFTTTNNNMLMWSHYANSHKGFCIEYDVTEFYDNNKGMNLYPVIYSIKMHDMSHILVKNAFNSLNINDIKEIYYKGIISKDIGWSYEKEFRLIKILDKDDSLYKKEFKEKGGISEDIFDINAIYLGYKMEEEQINYIKNLIKEKNKYEEKNIKIYQMHLESNIYGLYPEEVKLD